MNVLVTGGNGQLGLKIRESVKKSANKNDRYFFASHNECDITNIDSIENFVIDNNIGCIVNCAAYTNVNEAEDNYHDAFLINVIGVSNIVKIAEKHKVELIHISTDYVFGGFKNTPYEFDDDRCPQNVYGLTKMLGELEIEKSSLFNFHAIVIRTSWLYSENKNSFVAKMFSRIQSGTRCDVVNDQVGSPTYAGDLADFIVDIINDGTFLNTGYYHYCNNGVASWYDLTMEIKHIMEEYTDVFPCNSDYYGSKVKRPNYSVMDLSRTETNFNINIPYWKESLTKCVHNLMNNDFNS